MSCTCSHQFEQVMEIVEIYRCSNIMCSGWPQVKSGGCNQGCLRVPRARGTRIPLRAHLFIIYSFTRVDFDLQSLF